MKTLSINPFNLKPTVKKYFRKPKHVEIPDNIYYKSSHKLYNNLLGLQNNFDYMATNLGIDFWFMGVGGCPEPIPYYITCINKSRTVSADSKILKEDDSEYDLSRKICNTASKLLNSEDKKTKQESDFIKIKSDSNKMKSFLNNYKGILEFYTKRYDGMSFKVDDLCSDNDIVLHCTKDKQTVTDFINLSKEDEKHQSAQYQKIHRLVKDILELTGG